VSDLEPIKPYSSPGLLAHHALGLAEEMPSVVIPDEIVLVGKPAAVSLLAEGYATMAAIRARNRDVDLHSLKFDLFESGPGEADRTRGTQLGQLITSTSLFRGSFFARSRLAHSTDATGTADSALLESINYSFGPNNPKSGKKFYAELCLIGMHAYTTRAHIYGGGRSYLEGFGSIQARLALHNSNDQKLSEGLKGSRPEDATELEAYFESVLALSSHAISLMTDRAELIKRHESIGSRARRRLLKAVR